VVVPESRADRERGTGQVTSELKSSCCLSLVRISLTGELCVSSEPFRQPDAWDSQLLTTTSNLSPRSPESPLRYCLLYSSSTSRLFMLIKGERGGGGSRLVRELLFAICMIAVCVLSQVSAACVDRFVCSLCDSRLNCY